MKGIRKKILFLIIGFLLLIGLIVSFFLIKNKLSYNSKENNLINISSLSEEFMEEYLEEVKRIKEEDKENILIVTSKNELKENYGAINVIEAPNNQYILQYISLKSKNEALVNFKKDISIMAVDENEVFTLSEVGYNSWGIEKMSLDSAIDVSNFKNLEEVTVAIIDSGCDVDLINKYYEDKILETYDVLNNSTDIMNDVNGHGTHIAGTIAEGTPSNVKIIPIKVSDSSTMYTVDIITAINYVVSYEKADIINMSFGNYDYNTSLYNAITAANDKNIISVAAAGNDSSSSSHYPSAFDNTISIASVDSNLNKSSFSNYGSTITFSAPGSDIKSVLGKDMTLSKNNGNVDGDDDHEILSGTSMATPHAVNAIAILKSYNKNLTKENVVTLLKDYAVRDLGIVGKDKYFGYGFISFNPDSFCEDEEFGSCEEFGIFKKTSKISISSIKVLSPLRTIYNYGTVNNLNPTQLEIKYSNGSVTTAALGDLSDVDIIGYSPDETKEQTITVKWEGLETTFNFTNPTDWDNGWSYDFVDDSEIVITEFIDFNKGNYATKKLYIPEKIDGYNVVSIGTNTSGLGIFSMANKSSYEEIILPSTLTEISGYHTFADFDFVEKVTILSNSLKITSDHVFSDNSSLVKIDGTIDELGKYTFENNISLQNVTLSDSVTELPDGVFSGCKSLSDVKLPENIGVIGDYAFYNTAIPSITLSDSVKTIGSYAFHQVKSLKQINLSKNLESIGDHSLSGTSIVKIDIPDSLETIGNNAFAGTNISSFYLPKNVKYIGTNLFIYCNDLENLVVDEDNIIYDSRNNSNAIIETATDTLLYGTSKTIIPSDIKKIENYAFYYVDDIDELIIPSGVIEIGKYVFYGSTLQKVYIPSSVNTIGKESFKGEDGAFITIWTYSNDYARTYAVENKIPYEIMDLPYVITSLESYNFNVFDSFNADIYLYFDRGNYSGSSYKQYTKLLGRKEIIKASDVDIIYQNSQNSFQYGDTSFTIKGRTQYGEKFEKTFDITVSKLKPKYDIPTNLTAEIGQKLSEIQLPDGFEWMNAEEVISESGNVKYMAKFIPEDTINYEIVENIEIVVSINREEIEIIFDSNNGSTEKIEAIFMVGDDIELEYYTFDNPGYILKGWNTKADGSGTSYKGDEIIKVIEDLTLYAIWEESYSFVVNKYSYDEVNKYIDLIDINTSVEDFKKNFVLNDSYTIDVEYKIINDKQLLYTGSKTKIYKNQNLYVELTNIIRGEVSGDGKINYSDYVKVYNHIQKTKYPELNKTLLKDEYLLAADMKSDGKINYSDYVRIYNKIKELKGGN